jgi:hypothetical protein
MRDCIKRSSLRRDRMERLRDRDRQGVRVFLRRDSMERSFLRRDSMAPLEPSNAERAMERVSMEYVKTFAQ